MPVLLPTVPVLAGIGYLHGHPGDVAEEKLQPERDRYQADHQPGPGLKYRFVPAGLACKSLFMSHIYSRRCILGSRDTR